MRNLKKLFIVLAIGWGFLGCNSSIDQGDSNIQQEENYVQLAKKYEEIFLPKWRALEASSKPKLSEKELKEIAQTHNFDAKRIEQYKKEILQIAKSYGLENFVLPFDKYFFINPYTGMIIDKDYYRMAFAYLKYLEEKHAPQFKKADKMNKRISTLTRKYMRLVRKTEVPLKQQKLMEEYARKKKKIIKDYKSYLHNH